MSRIYTPYRTEPDCMMNLDLQLSVCLMKKSVYSSRLLIEPVLPQAYCVNGSKKCGKIYVSSSDSATRKLTIDLGDIQTVTTGDFCSKIETANSLTDAQFRALNPWLDANCGAYIGSLTVPQHLILCVCIRLTDRPEPLCGVGQHTQTPRLSPLLYSY